MGKRHGIARAVIALALLLAWHPRAFALDPALDINQYAHTAWKVREGFTRGRISAIAQTPDGYLWLGTEFGLLRFDGVRNVLWQPPPDEPLPSNLIINLLVAHDGALWIGTSKGLASWKDGKLAHYPQLDGFYVQRLLEDREGSVWAGALGVPNGRLCAFEGHSAHCYGEDGSLGAVILGLYEDSKGNLWVGVKDGLWRWKPGSTHFFFLPGETGGINAISEDDAGTLIIGGHRGLARFVDGKAEPYPLLSGMSDIVAYNMLRDRDGNLWITTTRGLLHVHHGKIDVFVHSDGLSSDNTSRVFEDREGNIWVTTLDGLDRFREFAVSTLTTRQGLSNSAVMAVLAAKDGSVWFNASGNLNRWNAGQITVLDQHGTGSSGSGNEPVENRPLSIFQDSSGQIWISTIAAFGRFVNGRFIAVSNMPGGYVRSMAEDAAGGLWIANPDHGLFHLVHVSEVTQIPWSALGHKDFASVIAFDPLRGGLWMGFFNGGVSYFNFKDGQLRSYTVAEGLGEGWVTDIRVDQEGAVWAATQGGLSRLKNGRVDTLNSKNGLPCDAVNWVIEDDNHSFWLSTPCGLIRVARSELDALASAVEGAAADKGAGYRETAPNVRIHATVFDSSDGVRSWAIPNGYSPIVARSTDGRLWFLPGDGVSVVDPHHLLVNKLPPPVHIEQIIADHKTYDATPDANGQVRLPPLIRDLQIDYTALSFVAPEKVLFRYKLEGWDRDWQDVGTRRQAFYSNLLPRNYTFRVMACNNSGVWNETGTFVDFSVTPAYYQTWWFRSLCVTAFLGVLYALYQLRLQQMERQVTMHIEGRVAERTRIARDLHDTLLQSFQGVLLKLYAVTYKLPDQSESRKTLEDVIEQARNAVSEGRDAVHGLRSSTLPTNEIAKAIGMFVDELAADHNDHNRPEFRVQVEGSPRDLAPLLRDEIFRIGCEALRNAFRHACAGRIEGEIHYDPRRFRLRVRDNGKGIAPEVVKGGRPGHYGLASMNERAKAVGGKIGVWSEVGSGTEIELTIPASIAYAKPSVAHKSTFSKRRA